MRLQTFQQWLSEMGSGPYIGNCQPTDNYQVFGACSDQNTEKKNAVIRKGQEPERKKKPLNATFKEFMQQQDQMTTADPMADPNAAPMGQQPVLPQKKKWKATKEQIISYWRGIRDDVPIAIKPISYEHKGSTYGEDGIRLTGSPDFIGSMLPRLKELLAYETPSTKLALVYRETESPSKTAVGASKTSYVFYLQVKDRGQKEPNAQ